jgi:putative ABC transport system permease protein
MSIIWRKVWRDLWGNKFRTLLVVLSTAVGVFALGLVFGLSYVMRTRMTESHRAGVPAHVTLGTSTFDQDVVDTVLDVPGVADAEGETWASVRWKSEGEAEWRDGIMIARADYEAQRMNLLDLLDGEWPGHSGVERALAAERMTSRHYNVPLGTTILVEFGRSERRLPIEGVVRYSDAYPPQLVDVATFFTTPETVAWLTDQEEGYNRLNVRLESFSEEVANEVGEQIQDRLRRMGLGVGGYGVTDPEVHGAQETIDSVLLILTVLGGLSLGLSGFLVVNMMNATVAQQVWQIGVMKVVGATGGRVMRVYLAVAVIYSLLSLLLAVPPGAVAAHLLAGVLLSIFNVPVGPFRLMPAAFGIQVAVGLVVPLLAALVPVVGGARISPHQAISNYGLGAGFGSNWLDRLIGRIRRLPRPLALSLRNTVRRKARVALTLITLVLGGVMFIVVMSVSASMNNTLEVVLDDFGFDVLVVFDRLYRVVRLVEVADDVPGVTSAEVWDRRGAQLSLTGDEEREVFLWGVPPDSKMFSPRILSGRGLLPGDGRAILLNSKIAADEGFQVGDEIELTISERESTWTVVGLILNVNNLQRDNFVPFDALARTTGTVNRGGAVMVMSDGPGSVTQQGLVRDLREAYTGRGMEPAGLQSADEVRQQNQAVFNAITYLMLAMAVLAAIVGSVGLMSTMSINVVERGREIGVMRAVGARSSAILGIFVVEGVMVGVLSWLLAVPLSYPGALLFNNLVGSTLFQMPLDFDYSAGGMVGWLAIVVVLSALSSLWPALRATQVSVREALAYE